MGLLFGAVASIGSQGIGGIFGGITAPARRPMAMHRPTRIYRIPVKFAGRRIIV